MRRVSHGIQSSWCALKATMQTLMNQGLQTSSLPLQPTRINRILKSSLVLVGCWLLPLMVQAQGQEPEWWEKINNKDPNYIIGYGSASTDGRSVSKEMKDEAWEEAATKIAQATKKTTINIKNKCKEIQQSGTSKTEVYRKDCTSETETSIHQTLSGLITIKQETVTRTVSAPAENKDNNQRKGKNRGKSPTTEQTIYYIALQYDKADLIGKVARVIKENNESDNPKKYCISPTPLPWVSFDKQLQDHTDVADDCVVQWRLEHEQGEQTDSQWKLRTLEQSWSITLAELRQLFWPILDVSSSNWLKLTINSSPLFFDEWATATITVHPTTLLPTNNLGQHHLSLFLVDQVGVVTIAKTFNNKPVKSSAMKAWTEEFDLLVSPTEGQPDSQSYELMVAVLCQSQAVSEWSTLFPTSGETPATGKPRFGELIAAIKSQRQKGSCHVAAQPYLAEAKK